ncbi:MAG: methyltransferase domain-containing protein [Proteobacteria bacterium]|nr:methyltransferase domain-containing protein [Pseudomonadota bacterium]MBU1686173.1 methyltransferase domain-containing protein [Pseudomonadota bacterium]
MQTITTITATDVVAHFTTRTARYDDSSRWCTDRRMLDWLSNHLSPPPDAVMLDVACGTGLVSKEFKGKVGKLIGVDLTESMFTRGRSHVDDLVHGSAECLPFRDNGFDLAMERQGIQFMDAAAAVSEMVRTVKPGGRVCLIQLCAYGEEDRDEYFKILRLRNPARRNFFVREDLTTLLSDSGCVDVELYDYISEEDVGRWADNGAIGADNQDGIKAVYRCATEGFNRYHAVRLEDDGRIIDRMLFGIAVGTVTT